MEDLMNKSNGCKRGVEYRKVFTLFVIFLFVNLPIASALSFSNIGADDISGTSATISWDTDEAASSRVYFGPSTSDLSNYVTSGDLVTSHSMSLSGLTPSTEFFYYVRGGSERDDNNGSYYSFSTGGADANAGTEPEEEVVEESVEETTEESVEESVEGSGPSGNTTETNVTSEDSSETSSDSTVVEELFLSANLSSRVKGDKLSFIGTSKAGAEIRVYVNGGYFSKKTVGDDGSFNFDNVPLKNDDESIVGIEASFEDEKVSEDFIVISDNNVPKLTVNELPPFINESSINITGSITEQVNYMVFVNDVSAFEGDGVEFAGVVSNLEEGNNVIKIVVTDLAGWSITEQVGVNVDTQPPTVEAEFEKGEEYYQNRAETDITGSTEPGSKVSLYVYRPLESDFTPDFKEPRDTVTADESGNFTFKDVDFESQPITLEILKPQEVPAELLDVSIPKLNNLESANSFNYYVFIIAEDISGKNGYWRGDVTINTCYSSNFDFRIADMPEFQRPLRLDPGLMDDGREEAHAVFKIEYKGTAYAPTEGGDGMPYQLNGVDFELACTQEMIDSDERFSIGCKMLKQRPDSVIASPDGLTHFLSWKLNSAERFSETEEDFWEDFQKRQIIFPLKISVRYQEYESGGSLSQTKTQNSCYDLGYFVDIPLDSQTLIPDWLANEGTMILNETIGVIDKVLPYLEKIVLITGITCFASVGVKTVIRFARIFSAKFEGLQGKAAIASGKSADEVCPLLPNEVGKLYLESTLKHWEELYNGNDCVKGSCNLQPPESNSLPDDIVNSFTDQEVKDKLSFDKRCSSTAGLWKAEAGLDQFYRWTCDRFLCRGVPAKWTDDEGHDRIEEAFLKQRGCAVTGGCVPLRRIENCAQYIENNRREISLRPEFATNRPPHLCWEDYNSNIIQGTNGGLHSSVGRIYVRSETQEDALRDRGIVRLEEVEGYITNLHNTGTLLAYEEIPGSGNLCGSKDETCQQTCLRHGGGRYQMTDSGFELKQAEGSGFLSVTGESGSCYKEVQQADSLVLKGYDEAVLSGDKYSAGFTKDCFIARDLHETGKYQCVCEGRPEGVRQHQARKAAPNKGMPEDFIYRQDRVFKETSGLFGTEYPLWRYYKNRDLSGAFGLNYITDYFRDDSEKQFPEVSPQKQYFSAWQTVCVVNIFNQLRLLRSILDGLNRCIQEAKYTGFQDAGMCKTLFAQHVCGLIYKVIAYAKGGCSSSSIGDAEDGKPGVMDYITAGTDSIYEAMDSGIEDLKQDYGNAKLDEYFSGGVQGVAQSMCLAAFGFDWPIGFDFIMDAAYSVPMKSTILVLPAEREFSHFDPSSLTAAFNYNIGVAVFPGCKIARYDTYLKCVSQGDMQYKGVSCPPGGCDCLNAGEDSAYQSEKEVLLPGGSGNNMDPGAMIDLPIEAPQKMNKHFRYDHVVMKMILAEGYKAEDCFDTGYEVGDNQGIFYYPIKDVSGPGVLSCSVEVSSGRYNCPQLSSVFYGDSFAYIETPYISCYEKSTGNYVSCDSSNLFTLDSNSDIMIKIHTNTDDKGYCMEVKSSGSGTNLNNMIQIPSGVAGQRGNVINLGSVTGSMFGEQAQGLARVSGSNGACPDILPGSTISGQTVAPGQSVKFNYVFSGSNVVEVTVENPGTEFSVSGTVTQSASNKLVKSGSSTTSLSDINSGTYQLGGLQFNNILSGMTGGTGFCMYRVQTESSGSSRNENTITVTATLKKKSTGSCMTASETVPSISGFGRSSVTKTIKIQKQSIVQGAASGIYALFEAGQYDQVITLAAEMINAHQGELTEAEGIYYYVAAEIAKANSNQAILQAQSNFIKSQLDRFFLRKDINGLGLYAFDDRNVLSKGEFQPIWAYLCSVADYFDQYTVNKADYRSITGNYGCEHLDNAPIITPSTASSSSGSGSSGSSGGSGSSVTASTPLRCEAEKADEGMVCQDSTLLVNSSSCISNFCQNAVLTARLVTNPDDWKCCGHCTSDSDCVGGNICLGRGNEKKTRNDGAEREPIDTDWSHAGGDNTQKRCSPEITAVGGTCDSFYDCGPSSNRIGNTCLGRHYSKTNDDHTEVLTSDYVNGVCADKKSNTETCYNRFDCENECIGDHYQNHVLVAGVCGDKQDDGATCYDKSECSSNICTLGATAGGTEPAGTCADTVIPPCADGDDISSTSCTCTSTTMWDDSGICRDRPSPAIWDEPIMCGGNDGCSTMDNVELCYHSNSESDCMPDGKGSHDSGFHRVFASIKPSGSKNCAIGAWEANSVHDDVCGIMMVEPGTIINNVNRVISYAQGVVSGSARYWEAEGDFTFSTTENVAHNCLDNPIDLYDRDYGSSSWICYQNSWACCSSSTSAGCKPHETLHSILDIDGVQWECNANGWDHD